MTSVQSNIINIVCEEMGEKASHIINLLRNKGCGGLKSKKVYKGDIAKVLDAIVCHLDNRKPKEADKKGNQENVSQTVDENKQKEQDEKVDVDDKKPIQKSPKICREYKNGRCKKRKEDCFFQHPDKCKFFCKNGTSKMNAKGCKKDNCKFLHPPICKNGKGCKKKKCPFVHLEQQKPKQKNKEKKENMKRQKKESFLEEGGLKKMMDKLKQEILTEIRHQILGTLTAPQFAPHPWRVIQ